MAAAAIPAAIGAAGSLGSAIFGARRSGAEKQALGAQTGALQQLTQQGGQLFGAGMGGVRPALSYYDTLLRGSRGAQAQAVAAPTAQLTDLYRGAARGIERSGIRGGGRDVALAELSRDRANQIGQLTTGVQPMAAGALASLGTNLTGMAQGPLGVAAGGYGQQAAGATADRGYRNQLLGGAGQDIGSLLFQVWRARGGSKPAGAGAGPGAVSAGGLF